MSYVKCCGFQRVEDVAVAVRYGADAVGFVHYEKSRRFVDVEAIARLCAAVPLEVAKVAVVVNPTLSVVEDLLGAGVSGVQLHGEESPELVKEIRACFPSLGLSKALAAKADMLSQVARFERYVDYFLIDTPTPDYGGSGRSFDWRCLQDLAGASVRYLIAGGLDAAKIAFLQTQALGQWGYDVSSALERDGVKDKMKIKALLESVRSMEV